MFCWFLTYNINQLQVYVCSLALEACSHRPLRPTPLGCHRARVDSLCHTAHSHWLSILIWSCIWLNATLSICSTLSFSAMSTSLLSMFASLLLSFKQLHQYHFSRFHIYVLIYDICFSLSCFTLYNRFQVHPRTDSNLFLFMVE